MECDPELEVPPCRASPAQRRRPFRARRWLVATAAALGAPALRRPTRTTSLTTSHAIAAAAGSQWTLNLAGAPGALFLPR